MIKRSALVYFIIFVVVAAVAIFLKYREKAAPAEDIETPTPVPTVAFLFSSQEGVVTSILVESREGKSLGLERRNGVWAATRPFPAETIQSSVEEAASQILALQVLDSLDLPNADVGLVAPSYTLTIGFSSGNFIIAQVGDETPTGNGYYVRKEGGPVLVVSKYGLLALLNLLESPPYVATPTPTITPTPTETLTPTVTPTPTPVTETPTATNVP